MMLQANKFRRFLLPESTQEFAPELIDRFKRRYGIGRITKAGESGGVDIYRSGTPVEGV